MKDSITFRIQVDGQFYSGAIEKEPCAHQSPHSLDRDYCAVCLKMISDSIKRCLTINKEDFREPTL